MYVILCEAVIDFHVANWIRHLSCLAKVVTEDVFIDEDKA